MYFFWWVITRSDSTLIRRPMKSASSRSNFEPLVEARAEPLQSVGKGGDHEVIHVEQSGRPSAPRRYHQHDSRKLRRNFSVVRNAVMVRRRAIQAAHGGDQLQQRARGRLDALAWLHKDLAGLPHQRVIASSSGSARRE